MILSPWTVIRLSSRGLSAGGFTTEPSAILNLLPWHGQLIVPPDTVSTLHPRWVHAAEYALNSPCAGWHTTTSASLKTLPPPTGISPAVASA